MKITKRQLRQIIKEEKERLVKEMQSPRDAVKEVERGLAALMLQKVLDDPDGSYEASEIFRYMYDIGFDDRGEVQAALDRLAELYNM